MNNGERGNSRLRFLDRYLGIPAVMAVRLWNRRKNNAVIDTVTRVAFLKTAAIGDTVLLSAVVRDFRDAYPDAHLTFFTASSNHEMTHLLSGIDKIVKLPANKPLQCIKSIRESGRYDVWIDFGPWPRLNALLSFFSSSETKIGFRTKGQARHYLYDVAVKHSNEIHELDNYKNLLKPLKVGGINLPSIAMDDRGKSEDRIVIHMFPGGYKSNLKEWPEQKWMQLTEILVNAGYEVFLTGAKADSHRATNFRNRIKDNGKVHVVAGKLNLQQTAELLYSSRLVISVNTGIMHLASALGCNLVALHGPTSVKRWGPLNHNSISLQSVSKCSPCLNLGFEYGCNENICMENIPLTAAVDAIRTFLPLPRNQGREYPPAADPLQCHHAETGAERRVAGKSG